MPSTYLINLVANEHPELLAPIDRAVPTIHPLPDGSVDTRKLKVENVVSTSCSGEKTLAALARHQRAGKKRLAKQGKKKVSKFLALRLKNLWPRATTLCFSTGNQVIAGPKSASAALLAHLMFILMISRIIKKRTSGAKRFRIQNMVASAHFGRALSISKLSKKHPAEFSYDPRLFPGARGRIGGCKTSFLLFKSGNAVITGAKTEQDTVDGFNIIYKRISGYLGKETFPSRDKGGRFDAKRAACHSMFSGQLDV